MDVGRAPEQIDGKEASDGLMDGPEQQVPESVVEARDGAAGEVAGKPSPGPARHLLEIADRHEHATRVTRQIELKSAPPDVAGGVEGLQPRSRIPQRDVPTVLVAQAEAVSEGPPPQLAAPVGRAGDVGRRLADPARCRRIAVVEDDQAALAAAAVRVRVDVLVDGAVVAHEVVQQEVVDLGEQVASMQQRGDLALVALDEPAGRAARPSRRGGTPSRTSR